MLLVLRNTFSGSINGLLVLFVYSIPMLLLAQKKENKIVIAVIRNTNAS